MTSANVCQGLLGKHKGELGHNAWKLRNNSVWHGVLVISKCVKEELQGMLGNAKEC